jgi:4-amino-4-deoxy-L-arabinose transferase-like glycosyltransferase
LTISTVRPATKFLLAVKRGTNFVTTRPGTVLFLAALAVRLIDIGRSPNRDELFHVLAAQSLLADGDLVVDGGVPYLRAWPFTYMLAGMFRLFGESLVVARLPGVLAGALLVSLVFFWVRSTAGRLAAWVAALLLCFDPGAIFLSQLGRFYGLHALLFFVGAISVYGAATAGSDRRKLFGFGLLASVTLSLAFSLQPTTALGVVGLLLWLAVTRLLPLARRTWRDAPRQLVIGAALAIVAGVLVIDRSLLHRFWAGYNSADDWAVIRATDLFYYHKRLVSQYAALWSLFPVLLVVAFARNARVTGFSAALLVTALFLASGAPMKADRYIFFIIPFFFTIAGIAIAEAIPWLRRHIVAIFRQRQQLAKRPVVLGALANAGLVLTLLFVLGSNRASVTTTQFLATRRATVGGAYGQQPDWIAASPVLRSLADSSDVVIAPGCLAPGSGADNGRGAAA